LCNATPVPASPPASWPMTSRGRIVGSFVGAKENTVKMAEISLALGERESRGRVVGVRRTINDAGANRWSPIRNADSRAAKFSPPGSVPLVESRLGRFYANARQNILFCMAGFRLSNNLRYFLNFWRPRRDSNSRPGFLVWCSALDLTCTHNVYADTARTRPFEAAGHFR
jgi:hypothetical protein